MATLTLVRGIPLTEQLVQVLIERIRAGAYPLNSQLPPENDLAEEFNVSRATVRSAVAVLASRGMLVRKQGVGTFVSRLSGFTNLLNEAMDFNELIRSNGHQPGTDFLRVLYTKANAEVAETLGIEPDQPILQSHKIFTADGVPVIYCVNDIPDWVISAGLVQKAVEDPQITEPLYDFLEKYCNQRVEYHLASIRAEISDNCQFPGMSLEPCVPILVIEEVGFNSQEQPVWHSVEFFPQNRMTFELVRRRSPLKA